MMKSQLQIRPLALAATVGSNMNKRNGREDGPETQGSDVACYPEGKRDIESAVDLMLEGARELQTAMSAWSSVHLEDYTATTSCWLFPVVSCLGAFPCLCVFFLVDNLLRLDRHMYNIGGFGLKPTVFQR